MSKTKLYLLLGVFFSFGVLATIAYNFETKYHVMNTLAVRAYISSDLGNQAMRELLHDNCYFTAQYLNLVKDLKVDMFEMDHDYCWASADKTIKHIKGEY